MTGHSNAGKRDTTPTVPGSNTSPAAAAPPSETLSPPANPDGDPRNEESIGPLLARANLLRMRGQWDEAVAACTEALRKVPESPTACSLLGDIYDAQGKLDDALQWYGMAVEFNPANKSDQTKLERVVQIQRQALLKEEQEAQARAQQPSPRKADAAEKTLEWLDRIFPPGKQEGVARFIIVIGVAIFLLLVSAASFVYFSQSQRNANGPQPAIPSPGTPEVIVAPPPANKGATAEGSAQREEAAPERDPDAPAAPSRPAPSTGTTVAPTGNARVIEAVTRELPAGANLISALTDEHNIHLNLDIVLPHADSEAPAATRDRVLRAAASAVRAAAVAVPSLESGHVSISLIGAPVAGSPADPAPQIAFTGETATTAVRLLDPAALSETQLRGLFTRSQWARSLTPTGN